MTLNNHLSEHKAVWQSADGMSALVLHRRILANGGHSRQQHRLHLG